jgi:uncharacterized protein YycO
MHPILQPLDIIFAYNTSSDLDILIAECGLNYSNILLNHVGLYLSDNTVIEANKEGVVLSEATDFCKEKMHVKRLTNPLNKTQQEAVIAKAKSYLNKQYNPTYQDTNESLYCSELIIRAFEVLTPPLFTRHPISFNNFLTKKIDERWLNYYKSTNDIPNDVLGSHPVTIFMNENLVDV